MNIDDIRKKDNTGTTYKAVDDRHYLLAEYDRQKAEIDALREMLDDYLIEWHSFYVEAENRWILICPFCSRDRELGHAPDCELNKLLIGGE